ncbi:hypothetical protein [Flagellimonas sp. S3867]|uniref:hypothetical protein n=1 Tax=Flagellimonas sp. S3867 TaxID=2768063 RepID=UPI001687FED1|nr:hypothetical protein [Flagellimonas sp. S3867]
MVSITLDKLIQHNQFESNQESTHPNYNLDYGYSDYLMAILKFPNDIEILDIDRYDIDFKNEYGEYHLNRLGAIKSRLNPIIKSIWK